MDALRVAKVERVILERTTAAPPHTRVHVQGTLHLTPHHLIFRPTGAVSVAPVPAGSASLGSESKLGPQPGPRVSSSSSSSAFADTAPIPEAEAAAHEVWVPYPTINVLQRLQQAPNGRYPLLVGTKTFDSYTLLFERDREGGAEDVWQSVRDCAVAQNVEQLYAFFYTLPRSPTVTKASLQSLAGAAADAEAEPTVANPLDPAPPPEALAESTDASAAPEPVPGWGSFNPRTEFARQGVGLRTKAWRFTDINRDYTFSPTYPAKLVVPTRISDTLLSYAAKYRSKARIPALSYLHWANHASITRSSQPMIGIKNARSPQDERLVECIFTSHLSPETALAATSPPLSASPSYVSVPSAGTVYGATPTNLIIDARPTTNAMANKAKGAGTENMDWYKCGKKQHLGIDNIHVMRNSLKTVCEALAEADASQLPVDTHKLRRSNWLKHIACILDGSLVIIRNIHISSSHVLIHCSDGWDRTSQLSAIAQLCLDPYYRTLEGFKVLVEKDWLAFGHMFLQRSGHLSSDKLFTATPDNLDADELSDDDFGVAVKGVQAFFGSVSKQFQSNSHLKEVSPVFHQFLDCVRQIQRQFPDRFEFNEDYLLDLHYHLYACQFGTFLFDSERQRRVHQGKNKAPYVDRTVSAWEWFDLPAQRKRYLNPEYAPALDDPTSRAPDADMGVLFPDPKDVRFWHRLFKRSEEEMNPPQSRFLAEAVLVTEEKATSTGSMSTSVSNSGSVTPSPRPPLARLDSTREEAGPSSAPTSATAPPAASPFSRGPPKSSGGGWNWSQLQTGALSAFNQIRSTASDALSQIRDANDDEMWASASTNASYAPGTGIGEGRQPSTTLPRTPLRVPSEANPWMVDAPSAILASERPSSESVQQPASKPASTKSASWNDNPWGEEGARRRLDDLSLAAVRRDEKEPTKKEPPAEPATLAKPAEDKALFEAALGGDSKAWDPLGVL